MQVHSSCPWEQLLDHLLSAHAAHADEAAAASEESRAVQDTALHEAKLALRVSQVISVCSEADQAHVIGAARRLCEHAAIITAAMDMSGAHFDMLIE